MRQKPQEKFLESVNNLLQNKQLFFWKLSSQQSRNQHNIWNVAQIQKNKLSDHILD